MITKDLPNKQSVDKLIRILQVVDLDFECLSCCQIIPSFISNLTEKLDNLSKRDVHREDFLGPKFDLEKEDYTSSLFTPLNLLQKEPIPINNETPYNLITSNIQSVIHNTPQKSKNLKNASLVFDNHNNKQISEILKFSHDKKDYKKSDDTSNYINNRKSKLNEQFLNQNDIYCKDNSVSSFNKKQPKGPSMNIMNTPNKSNQSDLLLRCHEFFQRSLFKIKDSNSKHSQNKSSNDKNSINICKMITNAKSEIEKSLKSSPYSSKICSNRKADEKDSQIITPLHKYSQKSSKLFQSNGKANKSNKLIINDSLKNPFDKFGSCQSFSQMEHLLPFLDKIDLQKTTDTKKEEQVLYTKVKNEFCLGKREFPDEFVKESINLKKKKN